MAIQFVNNVNFNLNQAESFVVENLATDPSPGGSAGRIIYNTSDDLIKVFNGTIWKEVGGGDVEGTGVDKYLTVWTGTNTISDSNIYRESTAGATQNFIGVNTADGGNSGATGAYDPDFRIASRAADNDPAVLDLIRKDGDVQAGDVSGVLQFSVDDDSNYAIAQIFSQTFGTAGTGSSGGGDLVFTTTNNNTGAALTEAFRIKGSNNGIKMAGYGSGSITGSATKTLSVDGAGNVIETVVHSGSGTVNTVPLWTGNTSLGDSIITQTLTSSITISGDINGQAGIEGESLTIHTGPSTITGELDKDGSKITNLADPTLSQDAATKAYVDSVTVGGLVYQGGYNASTNTPDLTTSPNSIEKGWTYTVTTDGTFFGEQLRVGDVLIAEVDDPSALADWTTVQNNIDLASLTQVGIGNVNASTAVEYDGLRVDYSSGTATVGLDIGSIPQVTSTPSGAGDAYFPFFDDGSAEQKTISLENLAKEIDISKGVRISLDGSLAYVTRTEAGGLTTFAVAVNNSSVLSATSALDVKAEIVTKTTTPTGTAGQTVFADITRSGTTLNVVFTGSVANGDFWALLVDIG